MKNLKLIFAVLIIAIAIVSCKDKNPVTPPDIEADYPELVAVKGKVVIAAKFEVAPCNDVVFVGSYNGWSTEPSELLKFTPVGTIEGKSWDGWYKVVVDTVGAAAEKEGVNYVLAGKPVQLTKDGTFTWDHQIGYDTENNSGVTKKTGDVDVYAGYTGECDIFYSTTEPVALIFDKWKKDPCVATPTHNYTFTVSVPASTPANAVVRIVGNFKGDYPGWSADAANMVLTKQTNGTYTITLNNVEEGTEYKYVLNGSWDNEELAAVEAGAECAKAVGNRKTGTSASITDKVENWRGVTAERCP